MKDGFRQATTRREAMRRAKSRFAVPCVALHAALSLLWSPGSLWAQEDTYHTWLKTQLHETYGITGGMWVTGETEDKALSTVYTPAGVTRRAVEIVGQPFTKGLNLSNVERPADYWQHFVHFRSQASISKGDVLLAVIWIRGIDGRRGWGFVNHTFELAKTPFTSIHSQQAANAPEWQQWLIPMQATLDMPSSWYKIHMGFQIQEFEVGGFALLNYGNSYTRDELPRSDFSREYAGRDPDAAWRAAAQQRIEEHRMAELRVKVVDQFGRPLEEAQVFIEMQRHAFGFGTSVYVPERAASQFQHTQQELDSYYQHFLDLTSNGRSFNWATIDDELRWSTWEKPYWPPFQAAAGQANTLNFFDWLLQNDIQVRGHMLVWPAFKWLPSDLGEHGSDVDYIRQRINTHIQTMVAHARLKGKVVDWNVINEPAHCTDLEGVFGGTGEYAEWFKLAAEADPNARLYVNEYGIVANGGMNIGLQERYAEIINSIDQHGGHVDGVGMEGHVGYPLTAPELVYEIIDEYANLGGGKEISISEYDALNVDEPIAGEYMRDFLTIVFSHPSVKSFLMWGFWDKNHWRGDAPLFREDWSKKPSGDAYMDLVFHEWWTDAEVQTDRWGLAKQRAFLGDYAITVRVGEQVLTDTLSVNQETGIVVVQISPGAPPDTGRVNMTIDAAGKTGVLFWTVEEGREYILEESADLGSDSWTAVDIEPVVFLNTASVTVPLPGTGLSHRFYRCRAVSESPPDRE